MNKIILLLFCLSSIGVSAQIASCGFGYKKAITINGGQVTGGPHTDFPVLISHTDADLTTASAKVTSANGFDIVFADDNGDLLDFQLEKYDGTTGQYVAWVKIPSITNGADLDIHMLYGKSTIVTDQSTNIVWDANYIGVWHMNQDPSGAAPQITEFSGGGNNGTSNGGMTGTDLVAGQCGDGIDFDGANDFINIGDVLIDGMTSITVEAWYNAGTIPVNGSPSGHNSNEGAIVHKNGSTDDNLGVTIATGGTAFYIDDGGNNTPVGTAPTASTWTHVVATWDNSTMTIYRNGVSDATLGSVNGTFVNNTNSLRFGGGHIAGGSPHEFDGIIDEIRISNTSRSANYIATTYNSQNQPTTTIGVVTAGDFYFIGTEEDIFHTSAAANDWDNFGTTWDSGELPNGIFETVIIQHDVDIDGPSASYTVCDCQISSVGTVTTRLDISAHTLTVLGDITGTGSGVGNFNVRLGVNGGQLAVQGDINVTNTNTGNLNFGITTRNAGIINLSGDLNCTNSSTGNDLIIDMEGTSDFNVNGDVMMSQTNGDECKIVMDDAVTFDIDGVLSMTQTGGDDMLLTVNENSGSTAEINVVGDMTFNVSGGDDIILRSMGASSLIRTTSDLTVNQSAGGRMDFDFTGSGMLDVDGTLTINQTGNAADGRMRLQGAGTTINVDTDFVVNVSDGNDDRFFIDSDNGLLQVDGNMDFNLSGGTGDCDIDVDIDGTGSINIDGNFTADLTDGDDIDLRMGANVGGSTGTWDVGGNFIVTQNVGVTGKSIGVDVLENSVLTIDGEFEINQSNTSGDLLLVETDDNARIDCNGDIDLNALGSGDIEIRMNGSSELQIFGDFDRTPSSFGELDMATTATLEFNGSTAAQVFPQDVGAGGDVFDYGIVEINNSFGTSPQITMEGLGTVHGGIIFMDGVLSSGAGNLLVVDNGAISAGASDNSHVDGLMRKAGTDAFEFPVGDQGVWAPIEISAPGGAVNFDAEYFFADHADVSVIAPLAYRSSIEHWTLDPDAATNVDVTLHWKDAARSFINTFTADLVVAHYDGADWESYGNDFMVAADPGEVRANGVTTFSPFTFGSLSSNLNINPLPVELLTWEAHKIDEGVSLDWETASEVNNSHFIIEKSNDGVHFEDLMYTQGAGNSSSTLNYHELDRSPANGWNYYRLIQYNHDGTSKVYDLKSVLYNGASDVLIYPNPTVDDVNVVLGDQTADLMMYDVSGKLVYQKSQITGTHIIKSNHLEKGLYTLSLRFGDRLQSSRLIVQ